MSSGKFVRGKQAASIIGCPRQKLYSWLKHGNFPPPQQEICGIAYWTRSVIDGFARGTVQKDPATGIWLDLLAGKPIPISLSRNYGAPVPQLEVEEEGCDGE